MPKGARADLSPKSDFLIKRYKETSTFLRGGKNGGKNVRKVGGGHLERKMLIFLSF